MQILTMIAELRAALKPRRTGTIALVPTMGALHAGHVSLMRAARARSETVVATIFVNPLQFGRGEDLERYPRTFEQDCDLLRVEGVDLLFAPSAEEMYPAGAETFVEVPGVGGRLDGASRVGHFRGVTTICAKLFHLVAPDVAFFGQKDAAQVAVLRAMVRDLNFDLELVVCATVRDDDGLALSSRNHYLTAQQRQRALGLSRGLRAVERAVAGGEKPADRLRDLLIRELGEVDVEYAEIVDPDTLLPVSEGTAGTLVAVAARVGSTRLIDNVVLG